MRGYDGAMPLLALNAVMPAIERPAKGITVELVYLMAEAGFYADLPPTGCSPATWLAKAMDNLARENVPARSIALGVELHCPDYGASDSPLVSLRVPEDGALIVSLRPGIAALRDSRAAAAACRIINSSLYFLGPERFFDEVQNHWWQGEDDESGVTAEYEASGETYEGLTRAQWDRVYPAWAFQHTSHHRGGIAALGRIAEGRSPAARFGEALLELHEASKSAVKACRGKFFTDLGEALGYDSWLPWGLPLVWSRKEGITSMVLDAMYDNAMQSGAELAVTTLQLPPQAEGVAAMRSFRAALTWNLREFAAVCAVWQALRTLEES